MAQELDSILQKIISLDWQKATLIRKKNTANFSREYNKKVDLQIKDIEKSHDAAVKKHFTDNVLATSLATSLYSFVVFQLPASSRTIPDTIEQEALLNKYKNQLNSDYLSFSNISNTKQATTTNKVVESVPASAATVENLFINSLSWSYWYNWKLYAPLDSLFIQYGKIADAFSAVMVPSKIVTCGDPALDLSVFEAVTNFAIHYEPKFDASKDIKKAHDIWVTELNKKNSELQVVNTYLEKKKNFYKPKFVEPTVSPDIKKADKDALETNIKEIDLAISKLPPGAGSEEAKKQLIAAKNTYQQQLTALIDSGGISEKTIVKTTEGSKNASIKNVAKTTQTNNKANNVTSALIPKTVTFTQLVEPIIVEANPADTSAISNSNTFTIAVSDTPAPDAFSRFVGKTQLLTGDLFDFRELQLTMPYAWSYGQHPAFMQLIDDPLKGVGITVVGKDPNPTLTSVFSESLNARYNQFFFNGFTETYSEKFQLIDTLSAGQVLFSFGAKPEFWVLQGTLINDQFNNWTQKMRFAWENDIRMTKLIERGKILEITIPALALAFTCYPVALNLSHSDTNEAATSFVIQFFKRTWRMLPTITLRSNDAHTALLDSVLHLKGVSVATQLSDVAFGPPNITNTGG